MLWAFYQLLIPLNYLRIKHGAGVLHSKVVYDWIFPAVAALCTTLVFFSLGLTIAVFSNSELMKRLLDLLGLMIVFYVAALAAVATFDRKGIDARLEDEDATLSVEMKDGTGRKEKILTYRQFISYLFGFLSFMSLVIYIILAVIAFVWPELSRVICSLPHGMFALNNIINPAIFLIVFFMIWQLVITSMLGIYFLTDRIQTLSE